MSGKKDHVWSLTVGSLYILGVKKDVKRAEQMEGEKKRERQNGQMGKCWEGRNYSVRGGVKTLLCKGKKITSEEIEGGNTTIAPGYKTEMQRLGWQ